MSDQKRVTGSVVLSKRAQQRMVNNSIDLMLSWGLDYDAMHAALDKHREAAGKSKPLDCSPMFIEVPA